MVWLCKKCKTNSYYPIDRCLICDDKITEIQPKSLTVVSKAECNIKTLQHGRTPFFLLIVKDEYGNLYFKKSYEDHEINEELEKHILIGTSSKSSKNTLGIVACSKIKYSMQSAIERNISLCGIKFKQNMRIVIKTSFVHNEVPKQVLAYHKSAIESLIDILEHKARNSIVTVIGYNKDRTDLEKMKMIKNEIRLNGKMETLSIPEKICQADLIINMPFAHLQKIKENCLEKTAYKNIIETFLSDNDNFCKENNSIIESTIASLKDRKLIPEILTIMCPIFIKRDSEKKSKDIKTAMVCLTSKSIKAICAVVCNALSTPPKNPELEKYLIDSENKPLLIGEENQILADMLAEGWN